MTDGTEPDQDPDTEQPPEDVVDAGSPAGLKRQARQRKRAADKAGDFWRGCLSTEIGRREIWSMLNEGGAFTAPFQVGPNGFPQPEATWFRAGQQALSLGRYQRLMALDFDGVRLMLTENDPNFKAGK